MENRIEPSEAHLFENTLEDFFKKATGLGNCLI